MPSLHQFAAGERPVWIDYYDYAARLLACGRVPWLDATAFMAFHGKAQGLLKSGVVGLPVEPLLRAVIAGEGELLEAMRSRTRTTFPLRKLFEHETPRRAIASLLEPLRAAHAGRPLVLVLPTPRAGVALAYELAFGSAPEIEDDDVGSAAVYFADLLRDYAGLGLDAVMLQDAGAASDADVAALEPIVNKAQDYRWELGLLDPPRSEPLPAGCGIDFLVSAALPAGATGGRLLAYGSEGAAFPPARASGQFRYVVVDAQAQPEALLAWLAALA